MHTYYSDEKHFKNEGFSSVSWRSVDAETIQPEIFENKKLNTLEDDTSEQASF